MLFANPLPRGFTSPEKINEGKQTYPSALVLRNQITFIYTKLCNSSSSVISDVMGLGGCLINMLLHPAPN
jgi:hypothetical protein